MRWEAGFLRVGSVQEFLAVDGGQEADDFVSLEGEPFGGVGFGIEDDVSWAGADLAAGVEDPGGADLIDP